MIIILNTKRDWNVQVSAAAKLQIGLMLVSNAKISKICETRRYDNFFFNAFFAKTVS